jgi:hypothetical protein
MISPEIIFRSMSREKILPSGFVSEKQLLPLIGVSSRSLFELRKSGKIPFKRVNARVIIYDPAAVLKALEAFDHLAK